MKKLLSFMMVAAIIMGFASSAISKDFSGVITYKISYPGMEVDPSMAAMMPKMATLTIKDTKSKFEISMGQMGTQIQIIDGEAKTVTSVMDMMGQKFYYVESEEDINEDLGDGETIDFQIIDETKEIAGYECKKAIVTVKEGSEEMQFTVFFTEEIGSQSLNIDNPYFQDVPGAMLEFEIDTGAGKMKMEAISVDKKKVADTEFEVPAGFEEKTPEEIKAMFGGGM